MRRFYREATACAGPEGFSILLDGRPVRTPKRLPLLIPSQTLADAIAGEWNAQGDKLDPAAMPLTGLANAAIDHVAPDHEAFARRLSAYGESDLLAYRAESPGDLVARQVAEWDPILDWARSRYDVVFELTSGIIHQPQPKATLERLHEAVAARSAFELVALDPLITISGSLVIALALAECAITAEAAWKAGQLDEIYQEEKWGEDELATRAREARRLSFDNAHIFLRML